MSFLQEIHRAHRASDFPTLTFTRENVFNSYLRARVGRDRVGGLACDELSILATEFERHIKKIANDVPQKAKRVHE